VSERGVQGPSNAAKVVFDFDDTLIVSRKDRANLLLKTLGDFGTPVEPERLADAWGRPFRDLVAAVSPEAVSRLPEFLWFYAGVLRRHPPTPCPGVLEAIPLLASQHRLFVLSASNSLLVRVDLETIGILGAFEFVCGSDWQSHPKPSPRSLDPIKALEGGSADGDWWYIGDSPTDATLASEAGLKFVGIGADEAARRTLTSAGVDSAFIIDSMMELPHLVGERTG
jgi:phosphoglycolate phosphatase-like HAD superfamily hydrolase